MKTSSKTKIVIIVALAAAIVSAYLLFRPTENSNQSQPDAPAENTINYDPPTEEEKQVANTIKDEVLEQDNSTVPNTAQIVIVDSSQYGDEIEVRAFVANVTQDGTCTVTFAKDGENIVKKVDAFADASTSPCINVIVPRSEFISAGEWTVTVQYANDIITGSASSTVDIE